MVPYFKSGLSHVASGNSSKIRPKTGMNTPLEFSVTEASTTVEGNLEALLESALEVKLKLLRVKELQLVNQKFFHIFTKASNYII